MEALRAPCAPPTAPDTLDDLLLGWVDEEDFTDAEQRDYDDYLLWYESWRMEVAG